MCYRLDDSILGNSEVIAVGALYVLNQSAVQMVGQPMHRFVTECAFHCGDPFGSHSMQTL